MLNKEQASIIICKYIYRLLNKDTIDDRIRTRNIIKNYINIKDINSNLIDINNKFYLTNKNNDKIILFDKQIGTKSRHGIIFLNKGINKFNRILKFSSKITLNAEKEISLLKKMSDLVLNKKTPHMPLIYDHIYCEKKCSILSITKDNNFHIIINELADEDANSWFKREHNNEEYESIIFQMLFSLYSYHKLGYYHNDIILSNFLIHKIKPGGYWYYKINNINIFVPNLGYLVILWL